MYDRLGVITQHRVEHLLLNDNPATLPNGIFHAVTLEAQGIPVLGYEFSSDATATDSPSFNQESYQKKNTYRKKYGLKPLTPDEFIEIEQKTRLLEQETKLRREQLARASTKKKKGLFSSIFENTCESNFDCERPEVCCDLIVKKICCSTGVKVHNRIPGQPALVPVPARPDGSPGSLPKY